MAVMNTLTHPEKARLLLVEDEPTALAALQKFFREAGLDVDCARELEEAEALIATRDYDVVIADLRLSWSYAVEGLEILRFIRRHSRNTHVIILSAHATPEIRESAAALGADAFLAKPAPLPEIASTVLRVLGRMA
jgi:two-component system OmpR family response regulator